MVLSDSDEDELSAAADDKENEMPGNDGHAEEDEEPRARPRNSTRRDRKRRSLGDETESKPKKQKKTGEPRRKTMGDTPMSKFHTQTLTQFMARDEADILCRDSEEEDGSFDDWLQEPVSPSPRSKHLQDTKDTKHQPRGPPRNDDVEDTASRQSSVVPRTPAKRGIRFEIPSSSQQTTPMTGRMLDRYGPPDVEKPSPSVKGKQPAAEPLTELPGMPRKLVIEDSFATESWGTADHSTPVKGTPLKDITYQVTAVESRDAVSSSVADTVCTPTRPRARVMSAELGEKRSEEPFRGTAPSSPTPRKQSPFAPKPNCKGVFEIPDSDEEDSDFDNDQDNCGPEEQQARAGRTDEQDHHLGDAAVQTTIAIGDAPAAASGVDGIGGYALGAETQFAMTTLASSIGQSPRTQNAPHPTPQEPCRKTLQKEPDEAAEDDHVSSSSRSAHTNSPNEPSLPPQSSKPLRQPLRTLPPSSQTQAVESQRVPLATIQGLGTPTNRTDILLPIDQPTLSRIISGHQIDVALPFRIPVQVSRLWLYERGSVLRYGACIEPAEEAESDQYGGRQWANRLSQVYELNNPLDAEDMCEEGWLDQNQDLGRYVYLPPAGVSQLLANLRHALFGDGDEDTQEGHDSQTPQQNAPEPVARHQRTSCPRPAPIPNSSSCSVSEQVEAQLRSDIEYQTTRSSSQPQSPGRADEILVPSTPIKGRTITSTPVKERTATSTPRATARPPPVHPSQATTVSQVSTPERQSTQRPRPSQHQQPLAPPPPPPAPAGAPAQSSSSILTFPDHESSPPSLLLQDSNNSGSAARWASQLLTKSQMLPDSLVRDDARVPPVIWDSDDDGASSS